VEILGENKTKFLRRKLGKGSPGWKVILKKPQVAVYLSATATTATRARKLGAASTKEGKEDHLPKE
jgi:hypothetical protein